MKIENIPQLPAHPPILTCWTSVMDSTFLFGTMWTIFIFYVFDFVFYAMTPLYRYCLAALMAET